MNRSDDFNRTGNVALGGSTPSDGGSAWVEESTNTIKTGTDVVSGRVVAFNTGSAFAAWLESGVTDHEASGKVVTSYADLGVIARVADVNNFYLWRVQSASGGATQLYKKVGGSFTLLASGSLTAADGDVLALRCVGTTITAYVNGASAATVTDSSLTAGTKAGIRIQGFIDDFSITDLSGGGGPAPTHSLALTGCGN